MDPCAGIISWCPRTTNAKRDAGSRSGLSRLRETCGRCRTGSLRVSHTERTFEPFVSLPEERTPRVPRSPTEVKGGGRPGALVSQAHAYPRPPVRVRSRDSSDTLIRSARFCALRCGALTYARSRVERVHSMATPLCRRPGDVSHTWFRHAGVYTWALFVYTSGAGNRRLGGRAHVWFLSFSSLLCLLTPLTAKLRHDLRLCALSASLIILLSRFASEQ